MSYIAFINMIKLIAEIVIAHAQWRFQRALKREIEQASLALAASDDP